MKRINLALAFGIPLLLNNVSIERRIRVNSIRDLYAFLKWANKVNITRHEKEI